MHELSVCHSLLGQVERLVMEREALAVKSVLVRIGPLSGVDPSLLEQAYPMAAISTLAESSKLLIEHSPVRVRCESCGAECDAEPNRLSCADCGSCHTQLISGDEMMLMSVELVL